MMADTPKDKKPIRGKRETPVVHEAGFDSAILGECRRLGVRDVDAYVQMPSGDFSKRFLAAHVDGTKIVGRLSEDLEMIWRCLTAVRIHGGHNEFEATMHPPRTPESVNQYELSMFRLRFLENVIYHVFWYMVVDKWKIYDTKPPCLRLCEGFLVVTCPQQTGMPPLPPTSPPGMDL